MITMVKIFSPMGCLSVPASASTLTASPRLDSDRMPARANASLKSRPRPTSMPKRSEVTARAATIEMATEIMAAAKYRPRMVATKPGTSTSSSPTMKKSTKTPISRNSSRSCVGSTIPVAGPRITPVSVKAMIEFRPKRLSAPSTSLATTMSSPIGSSTSISIRPAPPISRRRDSEWRLLAGRLRRPIQVFQLRARRLLPGRMWRSDMRAPGLGASMLLRSATTVRRRLVRYNRGDAVH